MYTYIIRDKAVGREAESPQQMQIYVIVVATFGWYIGNVLRVYQFINPTCIFNAITNS